MYSIIVPTFNRARHLGVTLESLLAQETRVPHEIIVVDNNSADETRSVVLGYEKNTRRKLRYIFQHEQGLSRARNAGIAASDGEVLVFVDDDVVASPHWLGAIAATYQEHPDAWCVGGKIILDLQEVYPRWFDPTSKYLAGYLSCLDLGGETVKLSYPNDVWGANFSLRREFLSTTGLFNPDLGANGTDHDQGTENHLGGEETDVCLRIHRLGGAIYYCGRAVVTHLISPSRLTRKFFRQRAFWRGKTSVVLFHQDHRRARWKEITGVGIGVVRAYARALTYFGVGDVRRGFECELTTLFQVGQLHQILTSGNWQPELHGELRART